MHRNESTPTPVAGAGEQTNRDATGPYPTAHDGVEEQDWLRSAALRYARHGFPVGPLRGKVPLTPHGHQDFTNDHQQVQNWWRQYPTANVGMRPPAGWVVLDIDPRNGGAGVWEQLSHGRTLPDTIVTRTGSGGWHWWFRLPYAGDIRGSAGKGIDVKTSRGYLVMPPSLHPDTGDRYMLQQWVNPAHVPVLPLWLRQHVYRPLPSLAPARRAGENTGTGLVGAVAGAVEGTRNSMLHWAACRALQDGLDLEQELTAAALDAGLGELEISRTLASARHTVRGAA